jgi:hypothetical protein
VAVSVGVPGAAGGGEAVARPAKKAAHKRCAGASRRRGVRARCARLAPRRARARRERLVDLLSPGSPESPAPPGGTPQPPATLSNVGITAKEFLLQLSRPTVAAGPVRFSVHNGGEDPHDLHVRREGTSAPLVSFPTVAPGDNDRRTTQLTAGRYVLWCSLDGHEAAGMHTTLDVE